MIAVTIDVNEVERERDTGIRVSSILDSGEDSRIELQGRRATRLELHRFRLVAPFYQLCPVFSVPLIYIFFSLFLVSSTPALIFRFCEKGRKGHTSNIITMTLLSFSPRPPQRHLFPHRPHDRLNLAPRVKQAPTSMRNTRDRSITQKLAKMSFDTSWISHVT